MMDHFLPCFASINSNPWFQFQTPGIFLAENKEYLFRNKFRIVFQRGSCHTEARAIYTSRTMVFRTTRSGVHLPLMGILSFAGQVTFDQPPVFDHRERNRFCDLPRALINTAARLHAPLSKVGFLPRGMYFKAAKRFPRPQEYRELDIGATAKLPGLQDANFMPETHATQNARPSTEVHSGS